MWIITFSNNFEPKPKHSGQSEETASEPPLNGDREGRAQAGGGGGGGGGNRADERARRRETRSTTGWKDSACTSTHKHRLTLTIVLLRCSFIETSNGLFLKRYELIFFLIDVIIVLVHFRSVWLVKWAEAAEEDDDDDGGGEGIQWDLFQPRSLFE